ncbi:MAG: fumarylacetoacetate hydrolase family protein [Pseudomonadales bacterium]|nr:fumarylacetoacetate hydrolase family protein [Pseudomonadales bacterium]MCP5183625.1 fumarylacetoacetate hydrolase family protein [Pseudomonadales bacterium]
MKRMALVLAGVLVLVLVGSSWWLTRPLFDMRLEGSPLDGVEILPVDQGLTFARLKDGRLLLITGVEADGVRALDVSEMEGRAYSDPVVALTFLGYDRLDYLARRSASSVVPFTQLGPPVVSASTPIAAGTNYRAHAEEVGLDGLPFLFPKRSAPSAWNAPVQARGRFDYEVELCAVPLSTVTADRTASHGYVLCNDFTDRWPLARDTDFDQPMGTTGFVDAKGGEGMLPLGALFVVPRDESAFIGAVRLELFVNGRLRQQSDASLMTWSATEIARQAMQACEQPYQSEAGELRIGACDRVRAGTILLTGTPAGVLFHPVTIWNPWAYLGSGDVVVARARWLGALVNTVE